jgi:hypothetical protein
MRHDPHNAPGWLRYLSRLTTWTPLRAQLEATADHWRDLLPEMHAATADAWHAAELPPKYRGRSPVGPGQ